MDSATENRDRATKRRSLDLRKIRTCYRAANWIYVGVTQGWSKFDRQKTRSLPRKAIFLYPLVRDFGRNSRPPTGDNRICTYDLVSDNASALDDGASRIVGIPGSYRLGALRPRLFSKGRWKSQRAHAARRLAIGLLWCR